MRELFCKVKGISRICPKVSLSPLFGVSALKGVSLPATSTTKNRLKILHFRVEEFSRSGFLVNQGAKRSKSIRICEYFNDE